MRKIEEVTKDIANYWIYNLSNSEIKTADDECNYLKRLLNEILEIHKAEKRQKGKWISYEVELPDRTILNYKCSVCGRKLVGYSTETLKDAPFCHCGADMRESEVKNNAVGSKQFEP